MSKKRTQYSSEFKAKIALAGIRGDETIPQLAARYGIHPTQINSWKRQLIEQAAELFSKNSSAGKESGQTKSCSTMPLIGFGTLDLLLSAATSY